MQRRDFLAGSAFGTVGSLLLQSDVFAQTIGSATQVSYRMLISHGEKAQARPYPHKSSSTMTGMRIHLRL